MVSGALAGPPLGEHDTPQEGLRRGSGFQTPQVSEPLVKALETQQLLVKSRHSTEPEDSDGMES